jgi:hypothetical protein
MKPKKSSFRFIKVCSTAKAFFETQKGTKGTKENKSAKSTRLWRGQAVL